MQRQFAVTKPSSELADLRAVKPVDVLPGDENLDRWNTGRPDPVQPHRGKAVIDEKMGRKDLFHAAVIPVQHEAARESGECSAGRSGILEGMSKRIEAPTRVTATGNKPKLIDE